MEPINGNNVVKPEIISQGKTVIAFVEDDGLFMIMHPDGTISTALTKQGAERSAKAWLRKDLGQGLRIGLGEIEWQ